MPRTAGLSGSSRVWFILRKPNDSTVALISGRAPIALFMRVALIILSATGSPSGGCRHELPTLRGGIARRLGALVGGREPLADHLLDLLAPQLRHLRRGFQLLERGQRGPPWTTLATRLTRTTPPARPARSPLECGYLPPAVWLATTTPLRAPHRQAL